MAIIFIWFAFLLFGYVSVLKMSFTLPGLLRGLFFKLLFVTYFTFFFIKKKSLKTICLKKILIGKKKIKNTYKQRRQNKNNIRDNNLNKIHIIISIDRT